MADLKGKACLVTGGSRGIGRAIALELGRHGASVAVGYASNADAAEAVVDRDHRVGRPGVRLRPRRRGSGHDRAGGRRRRRALRHDRHPRQQRGDHARPLAGQDVARGVGRRHQHEPEQRLPPDLTRPADHGQGRIRPDRQHQLGDRPPWQLRPGQLRCRKGGDRRLHEVRGPRARPQGHHGQRDRPGFHRNGDDRRDAGRGPRDDPGQDPDGPLRASRRRSPRPLPTSSRAVATTSRGRSSRSMAASTPRRVHDG